MPHRSIFLVGMMGAGKSTVGKALARRLAWEFIDADHEVEVVTGVRIPVIFEIEGESGFRKRETHVIDDLTQRPHIVLGTGGGAVMSEFNRECLRNRGHVIYLMASVEELYQRTRHDKGRPLLQTPNPLERLAELSTLRHPLYMEVAHTVVETGNQPIHAVVNHIIQALNLKDHTHE